MVDHQCHAGRRLAGEGGQAGEQIAAVHRRRVTPGGSDRGGEAFGTAVLAGP